jgi:uridine kinase
MNPIPIYIRNLDKEVLCTPGTTLAQLATQLTLTPATPWLAAFADYRLKDLAFEIYKPYTVEFITLSHTDGVRTYVRSLSFLMQKAVFDLYPHKKMILDYSVANGLYGVLDTNHPTACTPQEITAILQRMRELVEMKIPFIRIRKHVEEAIELFTSMGKEQKALLLKTRQSFYASVY